MVMWLTGVDEMDAQSGSRWLCACGSSLLCCGAEVAAGAGRASATGCMPLAALCWLLLKLFLSVASAALPPYSKQN